MTVAQLESLSHEHPIILYDGVCVLCNNFIKFVHKNDRYDRFRFATLQDESGQLLKAKLNINPHKEDDTVILMYEAKTMTHSDVSLEVFKLLGWPYKAFLIFSIIPKSIRDAVYQMIARNRYKWFGKTDECVIPTGRLKEKLLL